MEEPSCIDLTKILEDEQVALLAECAEISDKHIRSLFKKPEKFHEPPEITVTKTELV